MKRIYIATKAEGNQLNELLETLQTVTSVTWRGGKKPLEYEIDSSSASGLVFDTDDPFMKKSLTIIPKFACDHTFDVLTPLGCETVSNIDFINKIKNICPPSIINCN